MADEVVTAPTVAHETNGAPSEPDWEKLSDAELVNLTWRNVLPEDLRADKSLESFKDIAALAKSYTETKRMVGDAIRVPKEGATPDEWKAFHGKLGVPESPDKYPVTWPEVPGKTWDPVLQGHALTRLHSAGYTPKQAQAAIDLFAELAIKGADQVTARDATERREAEADLVKSWGPKNSPLYSRNLALAREAARVAAEKTGDPRIAHLIEQESGNSPAMVKLLAWIGGAMLEDGEITGDIPGEVSREDAEAQIAALLADKKGPYWNGSHPGHVQALEKFHALIGIARGGRGVDALTRTITIPEG